MEISRYFDKAKKKLSFTSDYALARHMKVSRTAITNYRQGKRHIDEYTAFKLAEILDIDPALIIAEMKAETEKNPEKQAFWQEQLDIRRVADGTVKIIKGGLTKLRIMPIMLNLLNMKPPNYRQISVCPK